MGGLSAEYRRPLTCMFGSHRSSKQTPAEQDHPMQRAF
jgi:hypothetical protein